MMCARKCLLSLKKYANIWLIERGGTGKSEKKFVEARLLLLSDDFVAAAAAVYCWLRFLVVLYIQSLYSQSISRNVN